MTTADAIVETNGVLFLFILALIPLALTVAMFVTKQAMLGFACVLFWAIFAGYCYAESDKTWSDFYYYLFWGGGVGMAVFSALAMYGLREKRDTLAEQDMEQKESSVRQEPEEKYVDEVSDNPLDTMFGAEKNEPSRLSQKVQKRAASRRSDGVRIIRG